MAPNNRRTPPHLQPCLSQPPVPSPPANSLPPRIAPQMYGIVAEYEAVHPLDAAALHRARYHERRRELVGAAQQLVLGLGLGVAQVWHAAVVLLDRCAAAGYQPRMDALLVAACVALAADKEGLPLGPAQLAALLDREVGGGWAAAGRRTGAGPALGSCRTDPPGEPVQQAGKLAGSWAPACRRRPPNPSPWHPNVPAVRRLLQATLSGVGAEPQAALQEEVQLVAAALQGDTACLSGEGWREAARGGRQPRKPA